MALGYELPWNELHSWCFHWMKLKPRCRAEVHSVTYFCGLAVATQWFLKIRPEGASIAASQIDRFCVTWAGHGLFFSWRNYTSCMLEVKSHL